MWTITKVTTNKKLEIHIKTDLYRDKEKAIKMFEYTIEDIQKNILPDWTEETIDDGPFFNFYKIKTEELLIEIQLVQHITK